MRRSEKPIMNPSQRGFTLIEAIVVIVITGIVAGMVAVFIRAPVEAYVDSARRADLTDVADTAARRIARELQGALPNSVREGDPHFVEFVPIHDAGRYRAEVGTAAASDDPLDFTSGADTTFDVLGPPVTVSAGDSLVVYNLGIARADVYALAPNNRRAATAGPILSKVTFTSTGQPLPFASPGSRFQIVGTPVSYVCDLGTNTLWRYSGYDFQPGQLTTLAALNALAGSTHAALATHVTACSFSYAPGPLQHNGLVSLSLTITQSGESVTLQHQVNVDNVP
jgi:MSHA biogenesis protein MshO